MKKRRIYQLMALLWRILKLRTRTLLGRRKKRRTANPSRKRKTKKRKMRTMSSNTLQSITRTNPP